jgi:hypothetical protein
MLAGIAGSYSAGGMDVCVVSKGKMQDNEDKETSRMKYRVQEKKNTGRDNKFFFVQNAQTDYEGLPKLLFNGYRDSCAGVNRAGREGNLCVSYILSWP